MRGELVVIVVMRDLRVVCRHSGEGVFTMRGGAKRGTYVARSVLFQLATKSSK